jgi:4-hydroxy-tetrahydrodipicolinate synthase
MSTLSSVHGVYTICPTPFGDDLSVDVASIRRLTDFLISSGVKGLAVLGFLGELHKLSDQERQLVAKTFVDHAAGRVPVWVGVRALGIAGALQQCKEAQAIGADAVFVAPLDGAGDALLYEYYQTLASAVQIPVVIHDFPDSFSTEITPEVIARLSKTGGVSMIKMEEPPVGQKITRIKDLAGPDAVKIFGGLGGVYFLEELQRGAIGTMTGFAFPEVLVAIYERFVAGDHQAAAAVFDRYCPLIRYEFQPKIGLALRKYVYQKRGAIATLALRSPGMRIDEITKKELDAVVKRVGLSYEGCGPSILAS